MASEDSLALAQFQRVAENGDLIFAALGQEFRIVIDDRLEQGILASKQIHEEAQKPEATPQRSSIPISRIQAKVRAGEDIAQIAKDFAISEALVRRFARTVETERQYAIDQFLLASVPGALRRRTVHEVLADSLSKLDVSMKSIQWTATRVDKAPWKIEAQFTLSGQTISAQWSWSFHDNAIAPLNATGGKLLRIARNEYDSPTISDLFELGRVGEAPAPVAYPPEHTPVRFDSASRAAIPAVVPSAQTSQSQLSHQSSSVSHETIDSTVTSQDSAQSARAHTRSADSWVFGDSTAHAACTPALDSYGSQSDTRQSDGDSQELHTSEQFASMNADNAGARPGTQGNAPLDHADDSEPTQAIAYRNTRPASTQKSNNTHAFATNPLRPLRSSSKSSSTHDAVQDSDSNNQTIEQIEQTHSVNRTDSHTNNDSRTSSGSNNDTQAAPQSGIQADSLTGTRDNAHDSVNNSVPDNAQNSTNKAADEQNSSKRKSRRSAVPSWQEILFGE